MVCTPTCTFVPITHASTEYFKLHMETNHTEDGSSPFVVKNDDASIAAIISLKDGDIQYASCPVEGCGEAILLAELDGHIEMHGAEMEGQDGSETESADEPQVKKAKLNGDMQASFGTKLSNALRNIDDSQQSTSGSSHSDRHAKAKSQWKGILNMPETASSSKSKGGSSDAAKKSSRRRLGVSLSFLLDHMLPTIYFQKSELGPHANEKQMPSWLVKLLESDGRVDTINRLGRENRLYKAKVCINQASGILPVIECLLNQNAHTDFAYLCHPAVKHVSKLKGEGKLWAFEASRLWLTDSGGFCGYRNIQMLCSYIIGVGSQGHDRLQTKIPSIFEIQEYIEHAWDLGINSQGRIETGGIRGRRVYIGTPDVSLQPLVCHHPAVSNLTKSIRHKQCSAVLK